MGRAISGMLLAAWAIAGFAATASGPHPDEARLKKAGAESDVAVLRSLVEARDVKGLYVYRTEFTRKISAGPYTAERRLPEALEPLIAGHFGDMEIGRELQWLAVSATHDSAELFDVALALARKQMAAGTKPTYSPGAVSVLVKTRRTGVEATLHDLMAEHCGAPLGSPRQRDLNLDCREIGFFLARRHHEASRNWFESRVSARQPGTAGDIESLNAIAMYKDRKAMDFLLSRLESLAGAPVNAEATKEADHVLIVMERVGADVPVDLARVHRASRAFPSARVARRLVDLVAPRSDPARVPILVDALGAGPDSIWAPSYAMRAIEAVESADAWRQARDRLRELERAGKLEKGQDADLRRLEQRLANPDRLLAEMRRNREQQAASEAAGRKRHEREALVTEARSLAGSNPQRASKAYREFVEATIADVAGREERPESGETLRVLRQVADEAARHERYARRDPRAAIALLRDVAKAFDRAPPEAPRSLLHWQVADILDFDLRDREGAAVQMEEEAALSRASLARAGGQEALFAEGFVEWMQAEASYLRSGTRAHGRPTEAMRAGVGMVMYLNAANGGHPALRALLAEVKSGTRKPGAGEQAKVVATLAGLPPSRANLFVMLSLAAYFPDEASMRQYLDRHDPAGAVSLVLLDLLVQVDRAEACGRGGGGSVMAGLCDDLSRPYSPKEFARAILVSRGHPGGVVADARLASPEETWAAFLAALRAGDRKAALECMTPELRSRRRGPMDSMDAAAMRAMADGMSPLALGDGFGQFREATVTRDREGGKQAFLVYFQKMGREWRISEM